MNFSLKDALEYLKTNPQGSLSSALGDQQQQQPQQSYSPAQMAVMNNGAGGQKLLGNLSGIIGGLNLGG